MLELENRIALVTGGASGIGLACCRALTEKGADVLIADRDGDAAERAADDIKRNGGLASSYQIDVSSVSQLRALLNFVDRTYGNLHILFNHAGVQSPVGLDITEEEFDHVINVNLKSLFFATSFAVPLMRRCAPHASIIFTSSTAALRAGRSPLYGATKAATLMLMRSVARQLGPDLIRANAICPGPTDTGFARKFASIAGMDDAAYKETLEASSRSIPLGRVAAPSDVSGTVLFLASDQSMYLTGVAIPVDGGLTA